MNVVNTMDPFKIYLGLNKWDSSSVNEYGKNPANDKDHSQITELFYRSFKVGNN